MNLPLNTAGTAPAEAAALPNVTSLVQSTDKIPAATDRATQASEGLSRKPRKGATPAKTVPVTTKARRVRTRKSAANDPEFAIPAYAGLSFVRGKPTRYGWDSTDLFAVPDEEYANGWTTGLKAFQELQQFLQTQDTDHATNIHVERVLEAAFKAIDSGKASGKSRCGAARAFIKCAVMFMTSMLKADTGRYMAETIADDHLSNDYFRTREAQSRAKFVERMRLARAAKREARGLLATPAQPTEETSFTEVGEGGAT